MHVLVVGYGSIGRRHVRNLRSLVPDARITVWRHASGAAAPEADACVYTLEDALARRPDVALICSPAANHVATALPLARAGTHLFVEKPLSNEIEGARELVALCERTKLTLMVGYNLRFLPSLAALRDALREGDVGRLICLRAEVGQYLPDWRPSVDYRSTASASAALGGGAILELSHEIDYVRWMCGEVVEVTAVAARLSDLEIDVEDTVELLLRFESGAIASVHLDMVQRPPVRSCKVIGTAGTRLWDGRAENVAETYRLELLEFFDCVRAGTPPRVTGNDGLRVLEIALAAKRSAREGQPILLRGPVRAG